MKPCRIYIIVTNCRWNQHCIYCEQIIATSISFVNIKMNRYCPYDVTRNWTDLAAPFLIVLVVGARLCQIININYAFYNVTLFIVKMSGQHLSLL